MKKLLLPILALMLVITASAQVRTPAPSPASEVKQTVGLTEVTVNYSRPSAKGRTIFGADGLVPHDAMWRTGANAVTKITFGDAVKVDGQELKAGAYAILTMPTAKEWKVMFYTYESSNWSAYLDKEATASVTAPVVAVSPAVETFTIAINNITMDGATIDFSWANTLVSVPMTVEVHKRVMADIERVMNGPSANDYSAAAAYLHETGTDLNMALTYIQKANAMGEPRFWNLRREALILADLERFDEAIRTANRSTELAEAAGNDDYVRMNKASIQEWSNR